MDEPKYRFLGKYKVVKRAGSYQITLPPELMHLLGATDKDILGFYVDENSGQVFIGKVISVKIRTARKEYKSVPV